MKLSIAIPTYNRKQVILDSLEKMLISKALHDPYLDYIISDNGSDDGTYEALLHFKNVNECYNMQILRSDRNYGYAANLKKVLFASTSKYTVIISDEDPAIRENIAKLWLELEEINCGFVSTLFYLEGKIYRGSDQNRFDIGGSAIRGLSNYLSGLIFNTKTAQTEWIRISKYLEDPRNYYPQVCLAAALSAKYGGTYLPIEVSYKLHQVEWEQIFFGGDYRLPKSRFNEFIFFCEFFKEQMNSSESEEESIFYKNALEWFSQVAFNYYINYLSDSFPEAMNFFTQHCAEYTLKLIKNKQISINKEEYVELFK